MSLLLACDIKTFVIVQLNKIMMVYFAFHLTLIVKEGQGNQCQTVGVNFESPVVHSNFSFSEISVLVTFQFCQHFSFSEISVLVTFHFW